MLLCTVYNYDSDRCPSPVEDGVFGFDEYYNSVKDSPDELLSYSYAFDSKEKLSNWFCNSDLRRFRRGSVHVYEYDVPSSKIRKGEKQCAFRKKDAFRKRRVPFAKLCMKKKDVSNGLSQQVQDQPTPYQDFPEKFKRGLCEIAYAAGKGDVSEEVRVFRTSTSGDCKVQDLQA